jgi:hypothetical protein
MYIYDNIETFSCNHCCCEKVVIISYRQCVFAALGIQHAIRTPLLSFVACPALQYFSTLSLNGTMLEKGVMEH